MLYHVSRNGQNYGPYTLEDLKRYVASGNILPTDMAKTDEMPDWIPVAQVLGAGAPVAPPQTPAYPGVVAQPYAAVTSPYPDPPNLHWALVLVIGIFTCGLFFTVWDIVQAVWMRKVSPRSNAIFLYIAEFLLSIIGTGVRMSLMFAAGFPRHYTRNNPFVGLLFFLVTVTLLELARFDMRRYIEEHYNG
jgi:hypothetical protein